MITDPLFIIGIIGMTVCLITWIRFNINDQDVVKKGKLIYK